MLVVEKCPSHTWSNSADPLRTAATLILLICGTCSVSAQVNGTSGLLPPAAIDEVDNASRSTLLRAEALLANGEWAEAIENIRQVQETSGQRLMAAGVSLNGFTRALPVQHVCQILLASLRKRNPQALQIYRRQVDPIAQQKYEAALAAREPRILSSVVDELFLSSVGDDAAYWLGEFALQRGDTTAARAAWESIGTEFRWTPIDDTQLGPYAGYPLWLMLREGDFETGWSHIEPTLNSQQVPRDWLAYPDSDLDLAEVRARLVLVSLLEGNMRRAAAELALLERIAPNAEGTIGGRQGKLVSLLKTLRTESHAWPPQKTSSATSSDWSTYAGAAARTSIVTQEIDVGGRPLWQVPLARQSVVPTPARPSSLRVAEDADGLLSHFPLVIEGFVLLQQDASPDGVTAYDLYTGQQQLGLRLDREVRPPAQVARRFTMSAARNRLYACVAEAATASSRIVGLDLHADLKLDVDIRLTGAGWNGTWRFDGAPVALGSRLYVAATHVNQVRNEAYAACFDALSGRLLWRQFVGAAEVSLPAQSILPQNLLSLDEQTLYFCTNFGVVAALDSEDGRLRWTMQYPRVDLQIADPDRNDLHVLRDLNPCLIHRGQVVVAPRDCQHIFCLDAISGTLLWVTPAGQAADAVHLLGVADDRLLASGECLYWFDIGTGQMVGRFPAAFRAQTGHARTGPRGFGRGLLAGKRVLWPTRQAIYVFEQRTSKTEAGWSPVLVRRIELASRGATGGHLLIADGVLLIAASDRLFAFNEVGSPANDSSRRPSGRRAAQ